MKKRLPGSSLIAAAVRPPMPPMLLPGWVPGYLGDDLYGRNHLEEMAQTGIRTDLVVTGDAPTPLSVILVKPDGRRTVINYNRSAAPLAADAIDTGAFLPGVILFDGHQPQISLKLVDFAQRHQIPTVLDAGSRHAGTEVLVGRVDYVVASEVFASQISGQADAAMAARKLHRPGTAVVVTLGAEGLVWRTDAAHGHLAAFEIDAVDTTGAGDAFHGAFATGLARGLPWDSLLRYASAAAALCCCEFGARLGMPDHRAVNNFIQYSDKG
jgi:sulfofructose kinase